MERRCGAYDDDMYVRYDDRCHRLSGTGPARITEMLELFLEWNVDPVSYLETQRNDYLECIRQQKSIYRQSVFNTVLWGGDEAEDRWSTIRYRLYLGRKYYHLPKSSVREHLD